MIKVGDINSFNTRLSAPNALLVYPNPFNRSANIIFTIQKDETVVLSIYDILGREVNHEKNHYSAGEHRFGWKGDDFSGQKLSPGLYHIKIVAGDCTFSGKAVIIK